MNKCLQCGQDTTNPRFCSRSCNVTYQNIQYPKRRKRVSDQKCIQCGTIISDRNSMYCSMFCLSQSRWQRTKTRIETTGIIHPKTKFNHSPTAKRYLTELHGNKCSVCGIENWCGKPLIFILDHINGKPNDWRVENLRLVCSNCDSQLPTYKSKNTGNGGRPNRRIK